MTEQTRIAAIVALSDVLAPEEMSELAGLQPDKWRRKGEIRPEAKFPRPARESSWQLRETADSSMSLSEVIEKLTARALAGRESLLRLAEAGCVVKLDIVHWISPADPHGPGFVLEPQLVSLLAELGATVDVDQYLE